MSAWQQWFGLTMVAGFLAWAVWISRLDDCRMRRAADHESPEPSLVDWSEERSVIDAPEPFGYSVFTRNFDEEIEAASLLPANRLQINAERLADVIVQHSLAASADRLAEQIQPLLASSPVAVTLLLDNSGSLRGEPALVMAAIACVFEAALDRLGASFEVLGFTTVSWHGGKARARWLQQGSPAMPGRLCELRHIVYKSFTDSLSSRATSLAVLLDTDWPKENIDGEALVWAYRRLLARPESRRILLVISDGAPVDDSTLLANTPWYLVRHLAHVIEDIEQRAVVDLGAIGIALPGSSGYEVGDYYSRSVTVREWADLSPDRINDLTLLFEGRRKHD